MSDSKQKMAEALRLKVERGIAEASIKPPKRKRGKVSLRSRWSS